MGLQRWCIIAAMRPIFLLFILVLAALAFHVHGAAATHGPNVLPLNELGPGTSKRSASPTPAAGSRT